MNRGEEQAESVTFVRSTIENFEKTRNCFLWYTPQQLGLLICSAHLFYGAVCFAGMFILWRCLLRLSGRPTAHNNHHFSPYGKNLFLFLSLFFFCCFFAWIYPPRALEAALLPHGPPVMFICSSTSLWFLWSLFLLRICLCLAGPRTFKMMKGGSAKCPGRRSFIRYDVFMVIVPIRYQLAAAGRRQARRIWTRVTS